MSTHPNIKCSALAAIVLALVCGRSGYAQLTLNAMSPASGSGGSQTFTFSGSSASGYGYITFVQMLFNWELDGAGACYAYYYQAGNAVYLQSDNGTQGLGGYAPGSSNTISNSQCTINLASTTVSGSGNTLTVNFAVSFNSSFIGPQKVFGDVNDQAGNTSGMQQLGSWTPYSASSTLPPSGLSVSPTSGQGMSQTFSFHASDANGYRYIPQLWMLFQTGTNPACYAYYEQAASQVYLFDSAGTSTTSGYLGSTATLSNSQCSIDLSSATTTGSGGNDLYLNLPVTFSTGFSGAQGIYELAYDHLEQSVGWTQTGTWTVTPITLNPMSPSSGSGGSQTFTFSGSSASGYGYITFVQMLMNWEDDGAGACYAYYYQTGNAVYLQNDNGTEALGGYAPGSSNTISNSQCTINLASTTVSGSGNTLTVNFAVGFSSSFIGPQKVFGDVNDQAGNTSGMQQLGSWTPYAASSTLPPSGLSVSPGSGSTINQTFSFHVNDANGYRYIPQLWILFQTSVNGSGACYAFYEQAANQLSLFNDAATGTTTGYLGSATVLSNSQCNIDLAHATTTGTGGNDLYLNLPITFTTAFAGAKNMYQLAYDHLGQYVGWTQTGSWTVPATAATTATALTVYEPDSSYPTYVQLTATVTRVGASGVVEFGTVTFKDNSTTLATVNVSAGTAASGVVVLASTADTITATYSGDASDLGSSVTYTSTGTTAQTISFGALSNVAYGVSPFALSATASSGLTVSFASTTTSVCTVSGNAVALAGVGTCSITATQGGNSTYAAAAPVAQSFTVTQGSQTIAFGPLSEQSLSTPPPALSATATSGLAVTFASTSPSVCTVTGTAITLGSTGLCSIQASQTGNADFSAATPVIQSFTVTSLTVQTITFGPISPQMLTVGPPALSATASSLLTVTFTSAPTLVCVVYGTTITLAGAGTCSITANQGGNTTYAPAPPVTQSFDVNPYCATPLREYIRLGGRVVAIENSCTGS